MPATATPQAAPRTYPSLRAAAIPLFALCLAFFVEMVDNTLLTIALPTIGRDLGAGTTALQWVTGAYSLTFGGLLLTAGSAADRLGRRRVLLVGLAAFGLISLAVVLVHTAGELIALRAALGLTAAAMAPITNSLVFRLFDDEALRMRAMTLMIIVGMSGFVLGPLLGGTALAHVGWEWLLVVNAPIALIAWVGVRAGVPADRSEDLTDDALDLPGAALSLATIGLGCYTLTSGVQHGWLSVLTGVSALGAVAALVAFVRHERRTAEPMLDLDVFTSGTVRGASIAQVGTSIAMAGVMFGLILHFQYAYGWSPVRAGLANLPLIVTMIAATPISEWLAKRYGHRVACLVGTVLLAGSLAGLAWGVEHGYPAIAVSMVVLTVGLRIVMTICAVALVDAMPGNRTSIGTALNDTRAGGRHQRRHRRGRHPRGRPRHSEPPLRDVEHRPGDVLLPGGADHVRGARRDRRPGGRVRRADLDRLALGRGTGLAPSHAIADRGGSVVATRRPRPLTVPAISGPDGAGPRLSGRRP